MQKDVASNALASIARDRRSGRISVILIILTVLTGVACQGEIPSSEKRGTPSVLKRPQAIGMLEWEIREVATGEVLDNGKKTVELKHIKITEKMSKDGRIFFPKQVFLGKGFYFEMAEFPQRIRSEVTGFGLAVMHESIHTFSWEWFNIGLPWFDIGWATKLQESGVLAIAVKRIDSRWEVTRTRFLTDISFRVHLFESFDHDNPKWRVIIRKGSYVTWPSLVGKAVVPND